MQLYIYIKNRKLYWNVNTSIKNYRKMNENLQQIVKCSLYWLWELQFNRNAQKHTHGIYKGGHSFQSIITTTTK